jgi:hypothetical protein
MLNVESAELTAAENFDSTRSGMNDAHLGVGVISFSI